MKRLLPALVAALLAAACTDHSATQYVGSVMNEANPEAEGSLRLTFFDRTDSSFTGVIELGAPGFGTGPAYAWHEEGELRIFTVGATTGDSIYWSSRLSDDALGGHFEITGGERAGETGTWRATLIKGAAASPATLQLPQSTPLPPWTATWPIALVVVTALLLARWVRRAPSAPVDAGHARSAPTGGWLTVFVVAQAPGILAVLIRLPTMHEEYVSGIGMGTMIPLMQPLTVLETLMQLIAPVVVAVGLWLTARGSHHAPRYWFAYLGATVVYIVADLIATSGLGSRMAMLVGSGGTLSAQSDATTRQLLRQLAITLVWAGYWVRSRRVRETFGAAALDRTVTIAPAIDPEAAPAAPRRWGRIALQVGGGVAALFLVLMAIGFWTTRATPWSVPDDQDIRDVVAGRWTWASDTSGCANAHTIAFADSGKVMTIASADLGAVDSAATYDIEVISQSTIRGAIRGETRTTDDGTPVVWDLVLTSPDEYRWKRTDWSSPWSYTGNIVRCPAQQEVSATEQ